MTSPLGRLVRFLTHPPGDEPLPLLDDLPPAEILAAARAAGLAPLLCSRLAGLQGSLPAPLRSLADGAKMDYLAATVNAERSYAELGRVLEHLEASGISTIVLKGPHLAEQVYRDRAVRKLADFDLLVRAEAMPAVPETMAGLGYAPLRPLHFEAERRFNCDMPFLAPQAKPVEIHWALEIPSSPFTIDHEMLWERSRPAVIGGARTRVLAIEDLVLHLVIHAAFHHRFATGPQPLIDLAGILDTAGPDRDVLDERAMSWGAERALHLMAAVLGRCTGRRFPPAHTASPAPVELPDGMVDLAVERLLDVEPPDQTVTFHLAHVVDGSGSGSRLRTLLGVLFPPPAFLAARYGLPPGSPRVLLRYPVRIAGLCRRHAGTLLRHLLGGKETRRRVLREEKLNRMAGFLSGSGKYPYHHI
jgi:hypothetical protein